MTITVIDLGLMLPADLPEPDEPPSAAAQRGHGGRIGVLMAVLLLFLGASAPITVLTGLRIVVRIPVGSGARMLVDGAKAIVADQNGGKNELSAYAIGTGRRLWRSTLDGELVGTEMFVTGPTIVVETDRNGGDGDHVEGFEGSTGAPEWIRSGTSVSNIGTGLLVYGQQGLGATTVELVASATGQLRWQTSFANDCDTYLASEPSQVLSSGLLAVCGSSRTITAVDLATGHIRARVRSKLFPVPRTRRSVTAPILRGAPRLTVIYLGDVVVMTVPSRFAARTLSAIRTSDLDLLWSGITVDAQNDVSACGPDLCVANGQSMGAIDRETGQPVPLPGDARADGPPALVQLLPQGTTVATPTAAGGVVQLAAPGGGNTWVEVRDGNGYRPIQLLRGAGPGSCSVISAYVACATRADQVTLWRVT